MNFTVSLKKCVNRDNALKNESEDHFFVDVLSCEQIEKNGRVVNNYFWKKQDFRELNKDVNYLDFSIENLTASGAITHTKRCMFSDQGFDSIDALGDTADYITTMDDVNNVPVENTVTTNE